MAVPWRAGPTHFPPPPRSPSFRAASLIVRRTEWNLLRLQALLRYSAPREHARGLHANTQKARGRGALATASDLCRTSTSPATKAARGRGGPGIRPVTAYFDQMRSLFDLGCLSACKAAAARMPRGGRISKCDPRWRLGGRCCSICSSRAAPGCPSPGRARGRTSTLGASLRTRTGAGGPRDHLRGLGGPRSREGGGATATRDHLGAFNGRDHLKVPGGRADRDRDRHGDHANFSYHGTE